MFARVKRICLSVVLATGLSTAAACGVTTQDEPVPLEVDLTRRPGVASPRVGDQRLTIYLVLGTRLVAVERFGADTSLENALAFLSRGAQPMESERGITTALPPQELVPGPVDGSRTLVLAVSSEFTSLSGDSQKLATAQLVWTATEEEDLTGVRFQLEGRDIEVPTDDGLQEGAVDRSDYDSVAPQPEPK